MTLSQVTHSDLPVVSALISACIRKSVVSSEADATFLLADISECLDAWANNPAESVHLKYTLDGSVVGVVLVKKYWNLTLLFVEPSHQRCGIGRALLHAVLPECRAKSSKGKLMVNSSTVGVAFYKSFGFLQTGPGLNRPGGCVPLEYPFA